MMRVFFILLLFCGKISFSQNNPQPTQFDKFVSKPAIQWAVYASDTFSFPGFNNMLLERLSDKKIRASLPVESRSSAANEINYISKDSIDKVYFEEDGGTGSIDTSSFTITEITQVLYLEKGMLKSYIPFVSPALPIFLSTGKYIGNRLYFNTAYNYKYNYKPRKRNKLIFLGQTKKMLKLDNEPREKLKEMYGQNLLESIWPYVLENGTAVFAVEGSRKLDPTKVDIRGVFNDYMPVPVYDSSSSLVNKFVVAARSSATAQFTDVQLVQDWYYDQRKNIVISNIREMLVYATAETTEGTKVTAPFMSVVF